MLTVVISLDRIHLRLGDRFFYDLHQQSYNMADPYLNLDSIVIVAKEVLEREVLLHPFEQSLNLLTSSESACGCTLETKFLFLC